MAFESEMPAAPASEGPKRSRSFQEVARREAIERRRQARGLVLLALVALLFSLWRFGFDRVFTPGWWRLW